MCQYEQICLTQLFDTKLSDKTVTTLSLDRGAIDYDDDRV